MNTAHDHQYMNRRPSIMPRWIYIRAGLTARDCHAILSGIARPSLDVTAQTICDKHNVDIEQSCAVIQEIATANGVTARVLTAEDLAAADPRTSEQIDRDEWEAQTRETYQSLLP